MNGDFSRDTFDRAKHFSRVLVQQGRVQLDADLNEQVSILLHYLRTLAMDLIGPRGGPKGNCGFGVVIDPSQLGERDQRQLEQQDLQLEHPDFYLTSGHYYVDGVLCENDALRTFRWQPDAPPPASGTPSDDVYLVYLDVWERPITYVQDKSIREVALGGPDTGMRTKLVWQVKVEQEGTAESCNDLIWSDLVDRWQPEHRGLLRAKAKEPEDADLTDPCLSRPQARYRGAENQLYRVQIHTGSRDESRNPTTPTFKWSRDNGSVVFPIRSLAIDSSTGTTTVTLEQAGRDDRHSLEEGNWVEIVDDDCILLGRAGALLEVTDGIRDDQVVLKGTPASQVGQDPSKHPFLRRWDHVAQDLVQGGTELGDDNALLLEEGRWLTLEDGIQVYFEPASGGEGSGDQESHCYRSGDYWLIPARTATGDVEWPEEPDEQGRPVPAVRPPRGVEHHYAPLAIISVTGSQVQVLADCRCRFRPLCAGYGYGLGHTGIGAHLI
jgi:hypothetical protein